MQKQKGFTLIELMITVAVIAILASIAIPSYREQVRKTNEAQLRETLMRAAELLERKVAEKTQYEPANTVVCDNTDRITCIYLPSDNRRNFKLTGTNATFSLWAGVNSRGTRCQCRDCEPTFTDSLTSCPDGTKAF